MTIQQISVSSANVATITIPSEVAQSSALFCFSDIHFDSCKCDVPLFEKHLKQAEECGAVALIAGDMFDAMQSHDDPRRTLDELKAEYKHENYLDLLVLDATKLLLKYKIPYIIGMGNHESAVQKKVNTNLIERLAYGINIQGGTAFSMGYWGFIRMKFSYTHGKDNAIRAVYWHHGSGANAPITKGVLDTVRQSSYLPDADVVVNGHNHQEYVLTLNRIRLTSKGNLYESYQHFIRTPGYKKAGLIAGERSGFDVEKFPAPTTRGCVRLDFNFLHTNPASTIDIVPIALLS